jgi:hypothetical protein
MVGVRPEQHVERIPGLNQVRSRSASWSADPAPRSTGSERGLTPVRLDSSPIRIPESLRHVLQNVFEIFMPW